jgi:hypothetical protein
MYDNHDIKDWKEIIFERKMTFMKTRMRSAQASSLTFVAQMNEFGDVKLTRAQYLPIIHPSGFRFSSSCIMTLSKHIMHTEQALCSKKWMNINNK